MKQIIKTITILLVIVSAISCQVAPEIKDIIKPIKLVSGQTDSIVVSDLFYSDNYNYNFKSNIDVKVNYKNEKLFLTAEPSFKGMTLVEFEADMNIYHIPIISKKEEYYKFTFKPEKEYTSINLFGSFNGWDRTNVPMTDKNNDGIFEAEVPLEPGQHLYKFFGDGNEIIDPLNDNKIPNGFGSFNSVRTIKDENIHKFYLHIDEYNSINPQSTFSFYLEDETEGKLTKQNIFALLENSKISTDKIYLDGKFLSIKFNYDELENQTMRVAVAKNGRISNIQTIKLNNGKPIDNSSFTWNDAIIYSLMIDRFSDGDKTNNIPVQHDSLHKKANYMGGDLKGIIHKLEDGYFNSLGINTLWISPVYDNPNKAYKEYPAPHRYYSGYHGYWPTSSNKVDEHFGDIELVKKLVAEAHKRDIKVLLDFVSNHVHTEHPYFTEHRDWFGQLELPDGRLNLRFWDEYRLTTWFEPYLASFDYLGSPEALETMTDNAVWWLQETGADGYRHDAVKHVPNLFWRKLNKKLKTQVESKREIPVYQIGETFGSYDLISSYVNNGQLHSQFNFNVYDVALSTFINHEASFDILDKEIHKSFSVYGSLNLMGNVMDSHDKNRFMSFADGDLDASEWSAPEVGWNNPPIVNDDKNYKKLILYMAYMNTTPGLPVIYYGSEFGMSGATDPDNRRMMRFGNELTNGEKGTFDQVKKIVNLRKSHTALRYGDYYTLQADSNIYAYIRSDLNERLLVVLNKSDETQRVDLTIPYHYNFESLTDLISQQKTHGERDAVSVVVEAVGWKVYKID
ncbi:MAG: hypothetical protein GY936_19065 [Ignavibacteriae bacterium]|nr:hypothetical protein [Ignavibacteriota bacterium]